MNRYITLQTLDDSEEYNTYKEWGLILNNKQNPPPYPKTNYVKIDGGDGTLDLTEAFGEIKFEDRQIRYTFTMLDKFMDIAQKLSEISNDINGRQFKIFHYDDPDYYYIGRLSINDFTIDRAKGIIELDATCKPYKYKKYVTTYTVNVEGSKTIQCPNEKKNVVPIITVDNDMTVIFNDNEYVISEGTHEILNIMFKRGINELTVIGNGTITIEYQEASL